MTVTVTGSSDSYKGQEGGVSECYRLLLDVDYLLGGT